MVLVMPKVDQTAFSVQDLRDFAQKLASLYSAVESLAKDIEKMNCQGVVVTHSVQKQNAMIFLGKWLGAAKVALERTPVAEMNRGSVSPAIKQNAPIRRIVETSGDATSTPAEQAQKGASPPRKRPRKGPLK